MFLTRIAKGGGGACRRPYSASTAVGGSVARASTAATISPISRATRPKANIHALQIEIDRSLYLAEDLRSPGSGFDRVAVLIGDIVAAIAARASEPPQAVAAE